MLVETRLLYIATRDTEKEMVERTMMTVMLDSVFWTDTLSPPSFTNSVVEFSRCAVVVGGAVSSLPSSTVGEWTSSLSSVVGGIMSVLFSESVPGGDMSVLSSVMDEVVSSSVVNGAEVVREIVIVTSDVVDGAVEGGAPLVTFPVEDD